VNGDERRTDVLHRLLAHRQEPLVRPVEVDDEQDDHGQDQRATWIRSERARASTRLDGVTASSLASA
jgi:hypothetical protein